MSALESLAEEAYVYAYPMLVGYGFYLAQATGPDGPQRQYVNRFKHFRNLAGPGLNNTIPWINTDFAFSSAWLDLRAEPMVVTVPPVPGGRFHNIQANDWYTMCLATRGARDRGNGGGTYLFAGPGWDGVLPEGVDEAIVAESWIVKLFARLLVDGAADLPAVNALQDGYGIVPLSAHLGIDPPPAPPPIVFPAPARGGFAGRGFFEITSAEFIPYLNFLLTLAAPHPAEAALMERFAELGIGPGRAFDPAVLDVERRAAIDAGAAAGLARIEARVANLGAPVNGWIYPLDLRGGRDLLAGSAAAYLRRAALAKFAIWGPPAEEVVYMAAEMDGDGTALDGARRYTLRLDPPPPVGGYWSFTVYDAATRLLSEHPSGRYKVFSREPDLVREGDGSIVLHLGHEPPARDLLNWLPVPRGRFQVVLRAYWPDPAILEGRWLPPAITPVA